MFIRDLLGGLAIGLPIMIAVGPIAILLLDQGLERGVRPALPAALGVASADLTFSVIAAIGGASIAVLLAPYTGWLSLGAVALLAFLAIRLGRASIAELRALRAVPAASAPSGAGSPTATPDTTTAFATVGASSGGSTGIGSSDTLATADALDAVEDAVRSVPFAQFDGFRLGAAFFGLTLVNPLTVVLFAAVVVAGGAGTGTPGWATGMALSSLLVHGGWVLVGALLGATLDDTAVARLRLLAAVFMAGLALHFLLA